MNSSHMLRLRSVALLILDDERFAPVYQPIVEVDGSGVAGHRVVGHEGLSRFVNRSCPERAFDAAARMGLVHDLELATMGRLLASSHALPPGGYLALNVSASLLEDRRLRLLLGAAPDDRALVLELSERDLISDYGSTRAALRRLGVPHRLAVDDLGDGFASMRHVLELEPEIIKVDKKLVSGIDLDDRRSSLLAALARFAADCGCQIVAEGVERVEEADRLLDLGIPLMQGFLFGHPAPAGDGLVLGAA